MEWKEESAEGGIGGRKNRMGVKDMFNLIEARLPHLEPTMLLRLKALLGQNFAVCIRSTLLLRLAALLGQNFAVCIRFTFGFLLVSATCT